jgi:hypothetical protein
VGFSDVVVFVVLVLGFEFSALYSLEAHSQIYLLQLFFEKGLLFTAWIGIFLFAFPTELV